MSTARTFNLFKFASRNVRNRYSRLAGSAIRSYRASCKLHCLECCGWDHKAAKECNANHCSLWAANRKIFG